MKKLILSVTIACLLFAFTPNEATANPDPVKTEKSSADSAQAKILTTRLVEINAMDKSNMSRAEKKALRKEVRSTESALRQINGGIYISAGAAILILVLLIILL